MRVFNVNYRFDFNHVRQFDSCNLNLTAPEVELIKKSLSNVPSDSKEIADGIITNFNNIM